MLMDCRLRREMMKVTLLLLPPMALGRPETKGGDSTMSDINDSIRCLDGVTGSQLQKRLDVRYGIYIERDNVPGRMIGTRPVKTITTTQKYAKYKGNGTGSSPPHPFNRLKSSDTTALESWLAERGRSWKRGERNKRPEMQKGGNEDNRKGTGRRLTLFSIRADAHTHKHNTYNSGPP